MKHNIVLKMIHQRYVLPPKETYSELIEAWNYACEDVAKDFEALGLDDSAKYAREWMD